MDPIPLLPGTLDLLVLETLRWGPQHGYHIAVAIRARSGEALQVDPGSLYPALHRLERQKLVAARWGQSEQKQRVRVYRLSPAGWRRLEHERSRWQRMTDAVAGVLRTPAAERES
ncbi:MAG: PadR family transcriptional regulator [Terriglobales bacterium]